uniref:Ig-like domain-containing protein n=1 Tax=Strigops habroptila TaxID=2489341 RepID=A0A672UHQ6_STRHB
GMQGSTPPLLTGDGAMGPCWAECSLGSRIAGSMTVASGDPRVALPSPGIPPKRAKVTAEPGAAEEGPARPAAPCFVRKLKNAVIGTGCDIRLRVVVVGNPQPSLRWYRNEELLAPREEEYGTLWIRDSKKEDAGVYTCIAENERGEAMTSAVLAIIDMEGKGSKGGGAEA